MENHSSESTDQSLEIADNSSESTDQSSESGDQSSDSGDQSSDSGDQSSESSNNSWESNDQDYQHHEYHSPLFEQHYRCYPMSDSIQNYSHLENGDKIILPESALERLSRMEIQYPMLFELRNPKTQKLTHCGVMEFSSEEGLVLLPNWMMEKMSFEQGDMAIIKNVNLPKGTYVKLQPHTSDFLQISDPKSVLETSLRSYSCFTAGDTIMIMYNSKKFYIDVLETKPPSAEAAAISIIETDCEVDFAPPLDYKEPERPARISEDKGKPVAEEKVDLRAFTGEGRRLDGNLMINHSTDCPTKLGNKVVFGSMETAADSRKEEGKSHAKGEAEKKEVKGFQAFTGKSYRLTD